MIVMVFPGWVTGGAVTTGPVSVTVMVATTDDVTVAPGIVMVRVSTTVIVEPASVDVVVTVLPARVVTEPDKV